MLYTVVAAALSFNTGILSAPMSTRAPVVSMASNAIASEFVYGKVPSSVGLTQGSIAGMTGKIVPTNSGPDKEATSPIGAAFVYGPGDSLSKSLGMTHKMGEVIPAPVSAKPGKPMFGDFVYGSPSKSPPCGIAHYDGSPN